MCGINGLYFPHGLTLSQSPAYLIKRMNDAIQHRGPDDHGTWFHQNRNLILGHRRLSILDLSVRGHQPMISPEKNVITFNGEIYNHLLLRKDKLPHVSFTSTSDTETLLRLYGLYGIEVLHNLNGMFAFAIWDENREHLFLARDRIGIKPLYYSQINGIFAFSSEIKALLTLPWISAKLDKEALYHFLTFNRVFPPKTLFEGIHKLHPGYYLVVKNGQIQAKEQWWDVEYTNLCELSGAEIHQRVVNELESSVSRRMLADVPVGAFLSGGVDSSAIVAFMDRYSNRGIDTFSVGFKNASDYDELIYAEKIAKKYQTTHHVKVVTADEIADLLPEIVSVYDEPLADATSIPIYFISQLAKNNGIKVVLTGDGSDEIFFGYRNWIKYVYLYKFFKKFNSLPDSLKYFLFYPAFLFINSVEKKEILHRAMNNKELFWGDGGFKEHLKRKYLSEYFSHLLGPVDSWDEVCNFKSSFAEHTSRFPSLNSVDWMCYLGLKSIIPNFYLYRADKLGMAHSVEIRVPFLDHSLVNLALSIRDNVKIANLEPKAVLKSALSDVLDAETLYRKKQGFCVPIHSWAQKVMSDYVNSNLKYFCDNTGLFNYTKVSNLVENYNSSRNNAVFSLWNIYYLINWHNKWM